LQNVTGGGPPVGGKKKNSKTPNSPRKKEHSAEEGRGAVRGERRTS